MKALCVIAATAIFSVSPVAFAADDGEALFKKHNCALCHAPDKKVLGPAPKDIADKYRGNNDAQAMLEKKVRNGGGGVWGKIPMPPVAKSISDESIRTIVQWMLAAK